MFDVAEHPFASVNLYWNDNAPETYEFNFGLGIEVLVKSDALAEIHSCFTVPDVLPDVTVPVN